jgi:hypothetical protein
VHGTQGKGLTVRLKVVLVVIPSGNVPITFILYVPYVELSEVKNLTCPPIARSTIVIQEGKALPSAKVEV